MGTTWYVGINGVSEGPFSEDEIRAKLANGSLQKDSHVWGAGFTSWQPIGSIAEFSSQAGPPPSSLTSGRRAHEIDYKIFGAEMQFVEVELDPGESAVAEAGSMMYMTDGIVMETVFGDGSSTGDSGIIGKLLGAGKRLITGESLFCTVFTNNRSGKAQVAFASPYPGRIVPLDLKQYQGQVICQKDAFLCAARGVSIGIAFQKKIGVALFGGEGFIMQKLEGDGLCFLHAGGTIVERELASGQTLRVDTGCLVALTRTVSYNIQFVGNVKSAIFGGEGFFYAHLTGPGHVWLQSLPFSRLAGRIQEGSSKNGGHTRGDGSVLGGLGGLLGGEKG